MSPLPRRIPAIFAVALLAACGAAPPAGSVFTPEPTPGAVAATLPTTDSRTPPTTEPTATLVAPDTAEAMAELRGAIAIDGSSTVFPITEAAATAFRKLAPEVEITLGVSGTGGGFKRFCAGETIISDASRPIKAEEVTACADNGVEFIELPIAYDGLSLVVNSKNDWAQCLTTEELRRIWEPAAEGAVTSWRDVRADWPDRPLSLYGAGADSGTFDYFTAAIVGEEGLIRPDYTASEDDYLLAQDLVADAGGLGFFGYAYVVEYARELRAVAVDNGLGCISPSQESIADGTYQPLSRPIFIYVRAEAMGRRDVAAFITFYLENAPALVRSARYIPLPTRVYKLITARASEGITGSVFQGDVPVGVSIEQLLALEGDH